MPRYNIDHFRDLAHKKSGQCLSDAYINCRKKLRFKCSCGFEWAAEPRHIIAGRWCPKCGHQAGRKYNVNHNFFSEDTETSFYVAGFLAADGWKTRKSGGSYTIGLQLFAEDVEHLKVIRDLMRSNSPLKFRRRINSSGSISYSYTIIINSEQLYHDLERFGVTENKTYHLTMPGWIQEHPLAHHFMRGYIDGDGCFCEARNKNQIKHVNFSMRGKVEFLENFHGVLLRNGICSESDRRKKLKHKDGKKHAAFDKLQYGGNNVISKMYDFLYKDATMFLERKRIIAAKSKEWLTYGDGTREKSRKKDSLPITKEILLEKARELKSGKRIAKHFGCTPANISWWVKTLNIKNEYDKALGKKTPEEIYELVAKLGSKKAVAEELGLTLSRICQITKRFETTDKPA